MQTGNTIIAIGIALILAGIIIKSGIRLGSLPGDIRIERDELGIYFPITTSIVISVLISLVFLMIKWLG